jgi:predicted transcriptional regulator
MDWNLISLITSSKVRFKVLTTLNKNEFTPTELSKELDIHISAVSRTLSELIEKELIVCLTDDRKKFKYYKISEKGKNILKKINDETKVSFD